MKSRRMILFSIAVLMFVAIMLNGIHLIRPSTVDSEVTRELDSNSNESDVRAFMARHKMRYVGYSSTAECSYGRIYGSSIGFMKGYILAEFCFAPSGKLSSHTVTERYQFFWE
jgi:hypothetical protein